MGRHFVLSAITILICITKSNNVGLVIEHNLEHQTLNLKLSFTMTERELRKLEGTIRTKMEEIRKQRVSLKDSGIGGLMNSLKKADEALYEKILPEYKKMVTES